ncbi:hypothetical protein COV12_03015 [Candidatus Woesearchaeota archaeon CG10_big_fil_rev_8_21_14_0_10_32_24]|nr:MAG: hypothetical protein COV12_03015 [Candidatus Woesearchaeota archaeon CG10_big_fil_rev_8_21_14_0_10_32_24]
MKNLCDEISDFITRKKALDSTETDLYSRVGTEVKKSVQRFLQNSFPNYSIHDASVSYSKREEGLNVFLITLLNNNRIPKDQMDYFYKNIQRHPEINRIRGDYGLAGVILTEEMYKIG